MAEKFRTSLDLAQLNYIVQILSTTETEPVMADSCLRSLRKTLLKATTGLLAPHYKSESVEEKLGLTASPPSKQLAFEKFQKFGATLCSSEELILVQEYKFENDLMTPEEELEYQTNLLSGLE